MVVNKADGKNRYDNLISGFRKQGVLQREYEMIAQKDDHALEYVRRQETETAAAWDKKFPNGQTLYRGIARGESKELEMLPLGSRVQFRPLISTSDDTYVANSFTHGGSGGFITFKDVTGRDVFNSMLTEPKDGLLHYKDERETIMRGNTHDWILTERNGSRLTLEAAPLSESERENQVIVIHSNMDFGSKKIVEEGVTYKTVKPRIKVREGGRGSGHSYFPELQEHRKYREGGVGSGNYGHDGRPGQRGGSAGGGSSIVPNIIARSIVRDGGITISTTGVRPRSGFAIAGIRNAAGDKVETVINGEAKPEDVQKFVNENKDILSQPNHYIGGWVNDGKTYLDVSEVHNDKATALGKAEARDEIAIYDLGNGEEHFTREDHLRPSESRAGRAA
jgi:hypothetical protein